MGARVKLRAGGVTQIREISGGGSYLSQSDLRQHFGLGSQTRVDSVEITWPSGRKQVFRDMEADSFVIINESSDRPVLLEPPSVIRRAAGGDKN